MSGSERTPPVHLVAALLRQGGIPDTINSWTLLGVSTSRVWRITVGERDYIVRYRLDADEQEMRKDAYLSDLLHHNDVPAPRYLAAISDDTAIITLTTSLPGIRLDHALPALSSNDQQEVWRSVGAALRRAHEIDLPVAGEIRGNEIEPFAGGWSYWVTDEMLSDIVWFQTHLDLEPIDTVLLERVRAAARDLLHHSPVRLVHNDALPQNILVAPDTTGWRCSGWIDWEFARAADPLWDVGNLDFRPAQLVPTSFYEGYGTVPSEPHTRIYELLMALWRTRVELEHNALWEWPPQDDRVAYLRQLPAHIKRLADLLGVR